MLFLPHQVRFLPSHPKAQGCGKLEIDGQRLAAIKAGQIANVMQFLSAQLSQLQQPTLQSGYCYVGIYLGLNDAVWGTRQASSSVPWMLIPESRVLSRRASSPMATETVSDILWVAVLSFAFCRICSMSRRWAQVSSVFFV